jgi:hypothetical protein
MGKYLGAMITAIIPAAVGMLISMIVVTFLTDAGLSMESISRLGLIALMSFAYISLFVLLGIVISSLVHRSSVSLLFSLSIWITLVIVVPNVAGVIAESTSDLPTEKEFADRHMATYDVFREWKETASKKDFNSKEEAMEELSHRLNQHVDKKMGVLDSYRNAIYSKEDLAINISRISPASVFELAAMEVIDAGVRAQRRFYRMARNYYGIYVDYLSDKVGKVRKHFSFPPMFDAKVRGEMIKIGTPPRTQLPEDLSDFPQPTKYSLSLSEGIVSGLWNIILLAIWNVALFMMAHLFFLRYDVR